jgi:hypothetical protein
LVVEEDFNAAIDRILAGKPTNLKLKQEASNGRLKLTYATVALEACRSRSLIAHENCGYQSVRARILQLSSDEGGVERPNPRNKLAELRRENEELKSKLATALNAQLEHFLACQKAEREAARWREAYRRRKETDDKVVPMRAL